jgi:hypothetical protein
VAKAFDALHEALGTREGRIAWQPVVRAHMRLFPARRYVYGAEFGTERTLAAEFSQAAAAAATQVSVRAGRNAAPASPQLARLVAEWRRLFGTESGIGRDSSFHRAIRVIRDELPWISELFAVDGDAFTRAVKMVTKGGG